MLNKDFLEELYEKYTDRKYVYPDPVGFLYDYDEIRDREIAGLIASSLAYGRVAQINKSVCCVLNHMNQTPYHFLQNVTKKKLVNSFSGFKHRFTTDNELVQFLWAIKQIVEEFGSLEKCFLKGINESDETIFPALSHFSNYLLKLNEIETNSLVPSPSKGSACKRLNLYMRWMIRSDNIDPGGWNSISKSKLVMPIDTHIHKFSLKLNLTQRKNADLRAALEITDKFKDISPEDPVKYDFALTRSSILNDNDLNLLLQRKKGTFYKTL